MTCHAAAHIAGGGCAGDNGNPGVRQGGYSRVFYGGVNGCGGKPGVAIITTGTGTATVGNCGGDMLATCYTPITELKGRDGQNGSLSGRGGGAGGAIGGSPGGCCCGAGGAGPAGFTCCGLCIGGGGAGAAAPNGQGSSATGYGGGGGGSSASLTCSPSAGNGTPGVLKVIQYFA